MDVEIVLHVIEFNSRLGEAFAEVRVGRITDQEYIYIRRIDVLIEI